MKVEDLTIKQIMIACKTVNGKCSHCNPSIFAFCTKRLKSFPGYWTDEALNKEV